MEMTEMEMTPDQLQRQYKSIERLKRRTAHLCSASENNNLLRTRSIFQALATIVILGLEFEPDSCLQPILGNQIVLQPGFIKQSDTSHASIQLDDFSLEFSPNGLMTVGGGYRLYFRFDNDDDSTYDYTDHWRA